MSLLSMKLLGNNGHKEITSEKICRFRARSLNDRHQLQKHYVYEFLAGFFFAVKTE